MHPTGLGDGGATNRGFPVLVVEENGTASGFASYGDYRQGEGYQHTVEHSVYVSCDAQGRGLGKALLAALIEHATAHGKHVMIAGIDADNSVSIEMHRKAGFEEAGRQRQVGRKFDRWLDLQFMQKLLPGPEHMDPGPVDNEKAASTMTVPAASSGMRTYGAKTRGN